MASTYERVKFSKAVCDRAATDGATQKLYLDTELPGFGMLVGARTKTFIVQRSVPGRGFERCTIDRYGIITLDEARKRAREMLLAMGKGESQVARRRKPAAGLTLREAWACHRSELEKTKASPRTIKNYEGMLQRYFSDLLDRQLSEITRADVRVWHTQVRDDIVAGKHALTIKHWKRHRKAPGARISPENRTGEQTANGALRLLVAIWNTSLREDDKTPPNPALQMRPFKVDLSRVKLQAAALLRDLAKWYAAISQLPPTPLRDLQLFMLFTGMRRTAATEVRWEHVDLQRRTLFVPSPKGGTEAAFQLPLSDYLVALLQRRQANDAGSSWVFYSLSSKSGHIAEPRVQVALPVHFTPHDLRRVFATVAESLDVSTYAIKALLNHAQPRADVTGGYLSLDVERLRGPMQQVTDRLLAMCGDVENVENRDNVVPLRVVA